MINRFSKLVGVILLLVVFTWFLPGSADAQDTPKEARFAAQQALTQGNFSGAIYPLSQLISFFRDTDTASLVSELETVYYNLGLCYFLTGDFPKCRTVFAEYLKRYGRWPRASEVMVYIGDSFRFQNKPEDALEAYRKAQAGYQYNDDWKADIWASMAKIHLAGDDWVSAAPFLHDVYRVAPDFTRRNWAATLLTIKFLKEGELEKVYNIMKMLLHPRSFASRSAALNMTAVETGDELFADERYRDALWIYRVVYPKDVLRRNAQRHLAELEKRARRLKRSPGKLRQLIRTQESIAETELEIEAFDKIEEYDVDLLYRIARSYLEIRRYHESLELFYYLYKTGEPSRAEECLYLAFSSAVNIPPWNRAFETGREYMDRYPDKEWYDTVSLTVGQIYANLQDWPMVIEVLSEALEVSPDHEDVVECMFLLGYACFMEERFSETVDWLVKMNTTYPGNDREEEGTYWTGMGYLFDKQYEEGRPYFDQILSDYPDGPYVEDSSFRSATCDFGLSQFETAEEKLLGFVSRYPDSKLNGEAYVMLGDVSGQFGELPEAVLRFRKVPDYPINIELYNYSQFRCAEMLDELADYDQLIAHMGAYRERDLKGSNVPMAIYWIGNAYWNKDNKERALDYYEEAVLTYGKDRGAMGIDLILEEWIGKLKGADPAVQRLGWERMRDLRLKAVDLGERTLALRVARVMLYDPESTDRSRETLLQSILNLQNLPSASAGVLEFIADEAWSQGRTKLALDASREIIEAFAETDAGLTARRLLAQDAIAQGELEVAIMHLNVVREVYATADEAAEALLLLGDVFTRQQAWDLAGEAYNDVLGVKGWKPYWPEALYGRGEVSRARKEWAAASAYYERIYLMYAAHQDWAAKAYLARAESLMKLREYTKAIDVLEELEDNSDLRNEPAALEAMTLLNKLRTQS